MATYRFDRRVVHKPPGEQPRLACEHHRGVPIQFQFPEAVAGMPPRRPVFVGH